MEYTTKDISVIIPTYNRILDLFETIESLPDNIKQIIIVDQSPAPIHPEQLPAKKTPIKIIYSNPPSITIARNKGLKYATGKLICYLDDDVTVSKTYFENIADTFNNDPEVEGVAGWRPFSLDFKTKLLDMIKWPLGLRQFGPPIIYGPYGNCYPFNLWKPIHAQWLPGMNMVFKKEIFDKYNMQFDEKLLGYTIAEDIDFTYSLYEKNRKGLIITPYAPIKHRFSQIGRVDTKRIAYINQVDHLYFAMKHNMIRKWWWNIFGITILRTLAAPFQFKKWLYYLQTLNYCFKHWDLIKQGKVREWNAS
jgi:glycosyltransferase involved in cell wall biosynthesis